VRRGGALGVERMSCAGSARAARPLFAAFLLPN